jgi:hypothetical protein
MAATASHLLLKFRSRGTQFGVTRDTVKAIAQRFDVSETEAIHMALSRLAKEELPAYEADDGPLTAKDLKALRKTADPALPKVAVPARAPFGQSPKLGSLHASMMRVAQAAYQSVRR